MIEFNLDLWKERAWARLKRAARKSKSKAKRDVAETQWYRDVVFSGKIHVIVNWCNSKGIKVLFGKKVGGTYDTLSKTICITGRAHPEKQLYYLLHECGHHLIGFTEHDERFGLGYPQTENPEVNTTFPHRLACLEEEIEAWHRGWKLSKRLKLKLNRKEFDAIRIECIRSYVKWATGNRSMKTY